MHAIGVNDCLVRAFSGGEGRHYRRAERALERQLDYQTRKSALMRGAEEILAEYSNVDEAKASAKQSKRRHLGILGSRYFLRMRFTA